MNTKTRIGSGVLAGALVAAAGTTALAQPDPDAPWGQWRGDNAKRGSIQVADAPALNHAWTLDGLLQINHGGLTIGSDGNLYFKARGAGGGQIHRVDVDTGSIVASSPDIGVGIGGTIGDYGGVAHGTNYLWTSLFGNDDGVITTGIIKLDKDTLDIVETITDPAFGGIRGEPILSEVQNTAGNYNMYVHDRENQLIHAVDTETGEVQWSYDPLSPATFWGRLGPGFERDGKFHIFYSGNTDLFPSILVRDEGDGTFTEVWFGGAESFNWIGTGALSTDEDTVYLTTFNDSEQSSLWSIDVETGSLNWDVPGNKWAEDELNFFGRPAVHGDRVYLAGSFGVTTVIGPNETNDDYIQHWEYREGDWTDGFGEKTSIAVAEDPNGDVYVYSFKQVQQSEDPNPGAGQLYVFRDDGDDYDLIATIDLDGDMLRSHFSAHIVGPDGAVYIAGFDPDDGDAGEVYKLVPGEDPFPGCNPADLAEPFGVLDIFDVLEFLTLFEEEDPLADLAPPFGVWDIFDVLEFLDIFEQGCP